jgi:hypothetical protein
MFLVAIAKLGSTPEEEAPRLAEDLGATAFDTRLLLARGVPAVVLRCNEKDRAVELVKRLRERKHQAVAFDSGAVTRRASMFRPRALEFGSTGVRAEQGELPYASMLALVHGTQPTQTESVYTTTSRKLDVASAVITGGMKMTKKVTQEHRTVANDREQFLFVYSRSGGPPWRLEEHGLHYQCLGDEMTTNRMENFRTVVARIRTLAPTARYDDTLLHFSKAGHDKLGELVIDEQAHLIALCTAKGLLPG